MTFEFQSELVKLKLNTSDKSIPLGFEFFKVIFHSFSFTQTKHRSFSLSFFGCFFQGWIQNNSWLFSAQLLSHPKYEIIKSNPKICGQYPERKEVLWVRRLLFLELFSFKKCLTVAGLSKTLRYCFVLNLSTSIRHSFSSDLAPPVTKYGLIFSSSSLFVTSPFTS